MPTYTYACTVCDHTFDIRQSFTEESLTDCPACFDATLRKVIHPVGITFKGSGFYKTDSRSSSTSTSPASSTSGSSASGGSSSSSDAGSTSSASSSSASTGSSSSSSTSSTSS